ncbi:exodeoxyribonuclease V subunit gamma [Pseudoduganella umbonata]|uniref:RecBCD enzyme subunit RecC n=1 Tax=Pseudoduganella umbonata TaxID=864828 RepID=A0A4P8HNJ1_9BURK|nr:exodeoxyribonuclease V subunit gamma [Pseudoduganella umbonata]MBB3221473.1 exodeoxyribonuclease V gamma subunit [Pseudoduganella umbonata]QCP10626.1 exodeoxyribonuclease V subunit gamma [Pseudoduganella umbonata]
MATGIAPGLLILHGNQLEQLRAAVFQWLHANPLAPLESDVLLVQSNGVAEWLKIALAEQAGVCAATRVALPARFLWEAYRAMLGRDRVPRVSAFDKGPLTWRLMRLLPALLREEAFEPLRHFLKGGCQERRLQLAERLSDLFDQYQVYRADWLEDWAAGRDQMCCPRGVQYPLPEGQRWQAALWRAIIASVPEEERTLGRAGVHTAFLRAVESGAKPAVALPRRIVLFGVSALPYQTLQALAALARFTQVIVAVPNPCRFYWGDIIDGRDLLRAARRRHPQRNGIDLAQVPIEALHAHSHPLLASWGRQGRDYIRMLDEFDEASGAEAGHLRVDLFSDGDGATLLEQLQGAVRDMLPLSEHHFPVPDRDDRSIVFHIAHSVQREVEVLHDQLLARFAADPALRPRDIVVMVPDIGVFTAAIHAVFGQYRKGDPRHIPFEIGDVNDRSVNPLLVALEWLLRLPQQRCRQSEVRDLLDVPALATRFGLADDDLAILGRWIEGAGVRWGLDRAHRAGLGLEPTGEQNAWIFGIRRMLLGYASGAGGAFGDIEPYGEVGGLDAALAGSLAQLVEALLDWRERLAQPRTPFQWGEAARALLAAFFDVRDEADRLTMNELDATLNAWLETCDGAGFDEPVPLSVLREAWMGALGEPSLEHQFVSGGVTFCTLMPMRAVPFRMVCLLGMNDGDFPRRASRADFDLLALPGMARPGDRSRRDDDRYLMLEAVLAARDVLYVSWCGRNARDNSEQPPSVLVAQLLDYLKAGWHLDLHERTVEHALQPFSRRYFEEGGLLTYAAEWRSAHAPVSHEPAPREVAQHESEPRGLPQELEPRGLPPNEMEPRGLPPYELDEHFRLKLAGLAAFLRQPVKYFFSQRLGVRFADSALVGEDEEPFALDALDRYFLEDMMLDDDGADNEEDVRASLVERAARLQREGTLPIGLIGDRVRDGLIEALLPVRRAWLQLRGAYPEAAPKLPVGLELDGVLLEDWIDGLRADGNAKVWLAQMSSKALDKAEKPGKSGKPGKPARPRGDKLATAWLRQLAAAAQGVPVTGLLVARDAVLSMPPLDGDAARATLAGIVALWRRGMDGPLPVASKTALALVAGGDPRAVYEHGFDRRGEKDDACLYRLWPEYGDLAAEPGFETTAHALYGPLVAWLDTVEVQPIEGGQP